MQSSKDISTMSHSSQYFKQDYEPAPGVATASVAEKEPASKRIKVEENPSPPLNVTSNTTIKAAPEILVNSEGDHYVTLSESKRLTVRKWNSKLLIDIREYYKDKQSGDWKPGKKGISLTLEQYQVLRDVILDSNHAWDQLIDSMKK